jgi:hypothetical protein
MPAKSYSAWFFFRVRQLIQEKKMRKIGFFLLSAAATVMVAAMPVFAQPGAANEAAAGSTAGLKTIGACVGFAIAASRRLAQRPVKARPGIPEPLVEFRP